MFFWSTKDLLVGQLPPFLPTLTACLLTASVLVVVERVQGALAEVQVIEVFLGEGILRPDLRLSRLTTI